MYKVLQRRRIKKRNSDDAVDEMICWDDRRNIYNVRNLLDDGMKNIGETVATSILEETSKMKGLVCFFFGFTK